MVSKRRFRKESSEKKVQKKKFRNKSLDQTETSPSQMLDKHPRDFVHGRKLVGVSHSRHHCVLTFPSPLKRVERPVCRKSGCNQPLLVGCCSHW